MAIPYITGKKDEVRKQRPLGSLPQISRPPSQGQAQIAPEQPVSAPRAPTNAYTGQPIMSPDQMPGGNRKIDPNDLGAATSASNPFVDPSKFSAIHDKPSGRQPDPMSDLIEERVRDLLAGQRDTSQDVATAREEIGRASQDQMMRQRALGGAMGMGMSGAQGALQADAAAMAAHRANMAQSSIEQGARDEFFGRVGTGLNAELDQRRQANEDAARQRLLDILGEVYGDGKSGSSTSAAPDAMAGQLQQGANRMAPEGGAAPWTGHEDYWASQGATRVNEPPRNTAPLSMADPQQASALGGDIFSDESGQEWQVFVDEGGRYYLVRVNR